MFCRAGAPSPAEKFVDLECPIWSACSLFIPSNAEGLPLSYAEACFGKALKVVQFVAPPSRRHPFIPSPVEGRSNGDFSVGQESWASELEVLRSFSEVG